MPRGWAAFRLEELPEVPQTEPGPTWHPLQHVFGLTAFGVNAFVAVGAGDVLVEAHHEQGSGQEELYVVLARSVDFTLDGERVTAAAPSAVAVRDPAVRREAVAASPGATLLALGGVPREDFRSTWRPEHFEAVPRVL